MSGMVRDTSGAPDWETMLPYHPLYLLLYPALTFGYSELPGLGDGGAIVIGVDDHHRQGS